MKRVPFDLNKLRKELARDKRDTLRAQAVENGVPMDVILKHAKKTAPGQIARCRHAGLPAEKRPKVIYPRLDDAIRVAEAHADPHFAYPCPDRSHWHTTSKAPAPGKFTLEQLRRAEKVMIGGEWYPMDGVARDLFVTLSCYIPGGGSYGGRRFFGFDEIEGIQERPAKKPRSKTGKRARARAAGEVQREVWAELRALQRAREDEPND